jgi:peptidoglycan hydrolase-like protein with peptidoglycan-binding domain
MKLKLLVLAIAAAFSASAFAASTSQSPSAQGSSAQGSSAQKQSAQGSSAQGSSAQKQSAQGSSAQGASAQRSSAQGSSAQGMSSDTVKQAQQALKDKGLDPGPIDGQYGPLTQKSVKEFQEKQNMKATGRLDQQTLSALGVQEGSSAVGAGADKDTKKKGGGKKDSKKEESKDKM